MPQWLKFYNQQKNIKNKLNIAMLRDDQIQNTNVQHYEGFPTIKKKVMVKKKAFLMEKEIHKNYIIFPMII